MEIIDRSTARRVMLNKYYTGRACKNGHIAERYTHNGSCVSCNRANNAPILGTDRAAIALVDVRVRLFDCDVESYGNTIYCTQWARCQTLTLAHVMPPRVPTHAISGTGMYLIRVHADDVGLARELAVQFTNQHSIGRDAVTIKRQEVIQNAQI